MIVFKEIEALKEHLKEYKKQGGSIGFVPTMGALHQGHLSLIDSSKNSGNVTVSSIFVNPTQFNDPKDYEKYPSTIEKDISQLESHHCDVLFFPPVKEIYPSGTNLSTHYDLGDLENVLEGKYRLGHFQGVCQVVHRLLNIVEPDYLFLGQKDYQQCLVIQRLIELVKAPVTLVTGETFREPSGLAMSSRNLRLTLEQREQATAIFNTLKNIKNKFASEDKQQLEKDGTDYLLANGFKKVDYVSIADAKSLHAASPDQQHDLVALIAATIGEIRLIDNMALA
jgi:pantoate--beta-alanine ligase